MLSALLPALLIQWSGIGVPARAATQVPVVIARAPEGRVPQPPSTQLTLRAMEGRTAVPAEWSITPDDAVTFNAWTSTVSDAPGTWVEMTSYRGPATVHATYGAETASLAAFVYNSLAPTCYMGYPNGVRFDDVGVAKPAGTPQESDVYTIGPQNEPRMDLFWGCTGAFAVSSRSFSVHFPYGATVIRRAVGTYFGDVRVSDWRNQYTTAPALQTGDIVVFRLHDGRTAKILVDPPAPGTFGGIYLTGPPRGDFHDYIFYRHLKPVPHAIFGHH